MRIIWAGIACATLAGCAIEVPRFAAAPKPSEDAALAAMLSDATGSTVAVDPAADQVKAQEAKVAALAEAFAAAEEDRAVASEDAGETDIAATPEAPSRGLLALFKPKAKATDPAPATPSPLAGTDIDVVVEPEASEDTKLAETTSGDADTPATQHAETTPAKPQGLFGLFKPKNNVDRVALKAPAGVEPADLDPEKAEVVTADASSATSDATPQDESPTTLAAEDADARTEAVTPKKAGLFAGMFAARAPRVDGGPLTKPGPRRSKSTVEPGEVLPFGEVGIACAAKPAREGQEVDRFPATGRAQWKVYDTNPSSTAPRTQFITGFRDGCARQVTASLILFGGAGLHETHRYSASRKKASWSAADNAYEVIKAKACGVKKGAFCPADKLPKLESRLAFVSVYKTFGSTKSWLELLLDNGKLVSQQIR